jgi:hypothetical protein
VILLETKEKLGVDGCRRKCRFFVDPQRGFAVVGRGTLIYHQHYDEWVEGYTVEGTEYVEAAQGIWLPLRGRP